MWTFTKLGSLAEFKNGLNFSRDNWGHGLKVIGVTDFQDYFYPRYEEVGEINPKGLVREADYLEDGDILFVRSNGNRDLIGRSLFIRNLPERISHSGFTIRLRFRSNRVFRPFYAYLFKSSLIRSVLSVYGGGTNISNLNQQILMKLDVPLPPTSIQQKIAAMLSAYDELIENNKRRIALLQKLAEQIYREWFVRFRFPGHDNVNRVKGFPERWTIERVKKIVVRKKFGRVYRESELYSQGQVVVIDQSRADSLGFYDGEPEHIASQGAPIILFGDHTCKMVFMTKPFSLAENVIPFEPKAHISPYFLFHLLKGLAKTTEYKRHWRDLITREVLIPDECLQLKFENAVRPNHQQIELLQQEIRNAEKSRNLLLPRLVSGGIPVENLNIRFPPGITEELVRTRAL